MRAAKINRWAAAFFASCVVAGLVMLAQAVRAETISTHNEEQSAYNAAIRIVVARGCTPEFRRTKSYTVDATPTRVTIVAKEVAQDCADKPAPVITWAHPAARKDGSPLALSEIRGYQITVDGAVTMLPPVTAYQIDAGARTATIRTVDTDGQQSAAVSLL